MYMPMRETSDTIVVKATISVSKDSETDSLDKIATITITKNIMIAIIPILGASKNGVRGLISVV